MEHQDCNEVIQTISGLMTHARGRRVNDALIWFIIEPVWLQDQLRGNESRLVLLIQSHEEGITWLVVPILMFLSNHVVSK